MNTKILRLTLHKSTLSVIGDLTSEDFTIDPLNYYKDGRLVKCSLDEIEKFTKYKYIGRRDSGTYGGNVIWKLQDRDTGEIFECKGYHSSHGVITIRPLDVV